jgi:hypothetical protein
MQLVLPELAVILLLFGSGGVLGYEAAVDTSQAAGDVHVDTSCCERVVFYCIEG